jgi:hypothetical protein
MSEDSKKDVNNQSDPVPEPIQPTLEPIQSVPESTQPEAILVDGYGVSFTPDQQERHWKYIKTALDRFNLEQSLPKLPPEEPIWKELPAGFYEKGTGI